ncbi:MULTISPECIES: universal stress protein [Rhodococcus]|uniref:Universal stress protein n=1 Tax=Rhodococcus cerastii TaxID=908616 RepID=A0ABU4D525_9NOCA|nr:MULTISPECIES: universal stress protein [Rhodococcus]MDV6304201.1 universal stress protein [Rhodococcus cerastii]MDV7990000.1 universal stress protein [Rhodococcus sp. IEGM 1374]
MILAGHQKIVVGVDGSPASIDAARWAATLAEKVDSPLLIAGAVQQPVFYMGEPATVVPTEVWDEQRRAAERVVTDVATAVLSRHPNLAVTTSVEEATACTMMVGHSRTARMLVVGNSGSGPIVSALFGSTAQETSNAALCPVIVWREGIGTVDAPILVGIDGSATSEVAVEQAFDLASLLGVPMIAALAWSSLSQGAALSLPGSPDSAEIEREQRMLLSECLAGWSEKYPDVSVEHIVQQGNPAHLLIDLSKRAGLVVVGSHGRGVVARALFGSTSSNLTRHARCPVMICRDTTTAGTRR